MRGGFVVITATLVALAVTPASQGSVTRVDGTVIKRARDAHSFVLVTRTGRMLGVQARRSPQVGRIARFGARRLSTGRYSARSIKILGRRQAVRVRGAVSAPSAQRRVFRLITRGASVLVHVKSAMSLPRRGTRADVRATIDRRGRLWLVSLRKDPAGSSATPGKSSSGGSSSSTSNGGGQGRRGPSSTSAGASATKQGGFIFMDGILVAMDPRARTMRVAPEDETGDDETNEDNEPDQDDPLSRGASDPNYGAPVTLLVERGVDLGQFHTGQKVRLVLRRLSTGQLIVEEADPAKKDDGSERDPDDGPDDGEGPDPVPFE